MSPLRTEAQHAGRRPQTATRLLVMRALGVFIGFLVAAPIVLALHAWWELGS